MSGPEPISHDLPAPELEPGWSGLTPGMRPVIATVAWTDGSSSFHYTWAYEWTRTHVRVSIEDHPMNLLARRTRDLWLPVDQVTADSGPPAVGSYAAAPDVGPVAVRLVAPRTCPNGHVLHEVGASVRPHRCDCPPLARPHRSPGFHSWGCFACSAVIYGPPPHDDGSGAARVHTWG